MNFVSAPRKRGLPSSPTRLPFPARPLLPVRSHFRLRQNAGIGPRSLGLPGRRFVPFRLRAAPPNKVVPSLRSVAFQCFGLPGSLRSIGRPFGQQPGAKSPFGISLCETTRWLSGPSPPPRQTCSRTAVFAPVTAAPPGPAHKPALAPVRSHFAAETRRTGPSDRYFGFTAAKSRAAFPNRQKPTCPFRPASRRMRSSPPGPLVLPFPFRLRSSVAPQPQTRRACRHSAISPAAKPRVVTGPTGTGIFVPSRLRRAGSPNATSYPIAAARTAARNPCGTCTQCAGCIPEFFVSPVLRA